MRNHINNTSTAGDIDPMCGCVDPAVPGLLSAVLSRLLSAVLPAVLHGGLRLLAMLASGLQLGFTLCISVGVAVALAHLASWAASKVWQQQQLQVERPHERMSDVAGLEEAKRELQEVVAVLRDPKHYAAAGARAPRGVLLSGAPGTGKTLLARALAGEAGMSFVSVSASAFVELYVGQGARRVREVFKAARAQAPCVVFIDELDAVGGERQAGDHGGGSHPEREQTLNQLLVELDGCVAKQQRQQRTVLVIAATNRPDILDPALVRPGRFDTHLELPEPDVRAREQILRLHTSDMELAKDVDLAVLARRTPGCSGAALAALVNAAALLAVRGGRTDVTAADLDAALDRQELGLERSTACRDRAQLRAVALHEAGHAIVAVRLLGAQAVHKVSVVARGATGGVTLLEPPSDMPSKDELCRRLAVLMGGRAGEERGLGRAFVTAGAQADLAAASALARQMVERWGMGRSLDASPSCSQPSQRHGAARAAQADREVADLLHRAHKRASQVLGRDRRALAAMAADLVERKTLSGAEVASALA